MASKMPTSDFTTFDSLEDIERRMQSLVNEKHQLTQTLQQNNLYMRQLSDSLLQWQNSLTQVHGEYQRKLDAAKSLIVELRRENCSLKVETGRKFSLNSALRDTTEALLGPMTLTGLPLNSQSNNVFTFGPPIHADPSLESFEVLRREETPPTLIPAQDSEVDKVTAQLLTAEDLLDTKIQELAQAQQKIRELEAENELIPLLKAQLEVFQADFQAEREARERVAGEKEALAERVRVLERTALTAEPSGGTVNEGLACPNCGLMISGLQPLQNHVEACLERDMFPC